MLENCYSSYCLAQFMSCDLKEFKTWQKGISNNSKTEKWIIHYLFIYDFTNSFFFSKNQCLLNFVKLNM